MNQELIVKSDHASQRLLALDTVRGLAVIGMFIQHFALQPWSDFVSGNTMILFILCSGISYSMMAQGMWGLGTAEPVFRARVLARAVFIDLIGYLILMLNGPFGVVLQAYAMLFLLALPLVKRSTKALKGISANSFLACPPLSAGWVLSLRKNGPVETAIRWFERQFYKEEQRDDETTACAFAPKS